MSRYRKVSVSMWGDRKFAELSRMQPSGQSLWVYLLTGPETCIIPGVLRAGKLSFSEALGWSTDDLERCFYELSEKNMAVADWDRRIVFLPNGIHYNPPENPSVARSWSKEFDVLPECDIQQKICAAVTDLMLALDARAKEAGRAGGYLSAWQGNPKTPTRNKNGKFGAQQDKKATQEHGVQHDAPHSVPHGVANNHNPQGNTPPNPHGVDDGVTHGAEHHLESTAATPFQGKTSPNEAAIVFIEGGKTDPHGVAHNVGHHAPHYRSSEQEQEQKQQQEQQGGLNEPSGRTGSGDLDDPLHPASSKEGVVQFELIEPPIDPVFAEFPIRGNPYVYKLKESKVREYEETFPGLDVRQMLRNCKQWNMDNPNQRKTVTGILPHISRWLSAEQNKRSEVVAAAARNDVALEPTPQFMRFWQAYPQGKGDQREALAVWQSLHASATQAEVDQIVKGVHGWSRSEDWGREGGRYIPNPVKFLREQRWKSVPTSRHFGADNPEAAMAEAKYSGKTLREIRKLQAEERANNR